MAPTAGVPPAATPPPPVSDADGDTDAVATLTPTSATAPTPPPGRRPTRSRPRPARPARPASARPSLAETAGPDAATPLAAVRLVVGTIVGPHGVRGEAKLRLVTDDPEHLVHVPRVYVGDEPRPRRLRGVRFHRGQALLRIDGIATPEAVDALRGQPVRIAGTDARPPAPGEYFLYQLLGLEVVDEAGEPLGRVSDLIETGAHDVLVVAPPGGGPDLLLPNHPDVVLDVRPDEGRMVVRPLVYE